MDGWNCTIVQQEIQLYLLSRTLHLIVRMIQWLERQAVCRTEGVLGMNKFYVHTA